MIGKQQLITKMKALFPEWSKKIINADFDLDKVKGRYFKQSCARLPNDTPDEVVSYLKDNGQLMNIDDYSCCIVGEVFGFSDKYQENKNKSDCSTCTAYSNLFGRDDRTESINGKTVCADIPNEVKKQLANFIKHIEKEHPKLVAKHISS